MPTCVIDHYQATDQHLNLHLRDGHDQTQRDFNHLHVNVKQTKELQTSLHRHNQVKQA